jgi:hypothetical protein
MFQSLSTYYKPYTTATVLKCVRRCFPLHEEENTLIGWGPYLSTCSTNIHHPYIRRRETWYNDVTKQGQNKQAYNKLQIGENLQTRQISDMEALNP